MATITICASCKAAVTDPTTIEICRVCTAPICKKCFEDNGDICKSCDKEVSDRRQKVKDGEQQQLFDL